MPVFAAAVRFGDSSIWVDLSDGRTIGVPFAWFPRLLYATPEQPERVEIGRMGLHWEELAEDLSIAGLLAGRGDRTRWGRRERNGSKRGLQARQAGAAGARSGSRQLGNQVSVTVMPVSRERLHLAGGVVRRLPRQTRGRRYIDLAPEDR